MAEGHGLPAGVKSDSKMHVYCEMGCGDDELLDADGFFHKCNNTCRHTNANEEYKDEFGAREFKDILQTLNKLNNQVRKVPIQLRDDTKNIKSYFSRALDSVSFFREETKISLDEIEKSLKSNIDRIKKDEENIAMSMEQECEYERENDDQLTLADLPEPGYSASQACTEIKEINQKEHVVPTIKRLPGNLLPKCNANITTPSEIPKISSCAITGQGLLQKNTGETSKKVIAKRSPMQQNKIKTSFVRDINVRSNDDLLDCNITGLLNLTKRKLIVVDNNNIKLKLINTDSFTIEDEIETVSNPWDLCAFRANQVAITIPSKRCIQIVKITDIFVKERYIRVDGECRGIAFSEAYQYQLIVSFVKSPKIEIIDLNGRVFQRIGTTLFKQPEYLCSSKDGKSLIISDLTENKIVMLRKDGRIQSIYTDSRLCGPKNVRIDNSGNVYVCGYRNKTIHMITPNGKRGTVILKEADGLEGNVHSLSVNSDGTIFVGIRFRDFIKAYTLS